MTIPEILQGVKLGEISPEEAQGLLAKNGYSDINFAKIDTSREQRTGIPEVVFGAGKTTIQIKNIAQSMYNDGLNILITRCTKDMNDAVKEVIPDAIYNALARTISYRQNYNRNTSSYICVVTAGTSDIPVAEEAVVTAEFLGNRVEKIFDVGVAGIHRLFDKLEIIRNARAIIVVAGMEGALASVIGGLVDKPVIAVPTSIGYGANFGGISALLSMLNSCASGVIVVNIDNGFGAACQASLINKLK